MKFGCMELSNLFMVMGGPHYHTLIKAKKSQVTLWKIRENSFGCMELCNFFMVMGGPHYNTLIKAKEKSGHFGKN